MKLLVQKLGFQNDIGMTNHGILYEYPKDKKTNMKKRTKDMLIVLRHPHTRDRGECYHNQTLNRHVHMVQVAEVT